MVDFQIIAIIAPIHLFAQFWYHTTYIGKMGFLENIIVTPSHHRVHHAINPLYIDKNHGQIFIFWDKLFGTYKNIPVKEIKYGLEEFDSAERQSFWFLLKSPFLNVKTEK